MSYSYYTSAEVYHLIFSLMVIHLSQCPIKTVMQSRLPLYQVR